MSRRPPCSMEPRPVGNGHDLVVVFPDPGAGMSDAEFPDGHARVFHQPGRITREADVIRGRVTEPADPAPVSVPSHPPGQAIGHGKVTVEPGAYPVEFAGTPVLPSAQATGVVERMEEAQMRAAAAAPIGRDKSDIHGMNPRAWRALSLKRGKAGDSTPSGSVPDGWSFLCDVRHEEHVMPLARGFREVRGRRNVRSRASQLPETQCWFAVRARHEEGRD